MRTIIKVLGGLAVLIVVAIAGVIGERAGESVSEMVFSSSEADIAVILKETAETMNKSLPMTIDADTRLDTTTGIGGEFRYNYTITSYAVEDLSAADFVANMRPSIRNAVCTLEEMKVFQDAKVPVSYSYRGMNGKALTTITITPSDCIGN